ncbi:MAG TPA: hypothetical protein VNP03_25980 [Pseudonocardia sp.]|nr:hypothetical protein [Pseudonocardia sp.]
MGEQLVSTSVHRLLPPKRLAPPEQRKLIDLAFTSRERTAVTVTWSDGRAAHATDEPGLVNLRNYPTTNVARVDVDYADRSRLVYEPIRGVVTTTAHCGAEAIACARTLWDVYAAMPGRRGAIVAAKVILRVSLIAVLVASALLLLDLAVRLPDPYRVGLLVVWGVLLVGGGAWSEYLESEYLGWAVHPAHPMPPRARWYRRPAVVIAALSAMAAVAVVAAAVLVRLHLL